MSRGILYGTLVATTIALAGYDSAPTATDNFRIGRLIGADPDPDPQPPPCDTDNAPERVCDARPDKICLSTVFKCAPAPVGFLNQWLCGENLGQLRCNNSDCYAANNDVLNAKCKQNTP